MAALSTGLALPSDGTVHRVDAPLLIVVADGLGGHPNGHEASKIAVDTIIDARPTDAESLAKAVRQANEVIVAAMNYDVGNVGMGTTVAVVLATEEAIVVGNVGDTSVWELVDDRLAQLSTDDSPAGRSGLPGVPSYVVTQTLGGGRSLVDVDPHILEDRVEGERVDLGVLRRSHELRRPPSDRCNAPRRRPPEDRRTGSARFGRWCARQRDSRGPASHLRSKRGPRYSVRRSRVAAAVSLISSSSSSR